MNATVSTEGIHRPITLVTGSTGKTGRRVVSRLRARGITVRSASRSATPAFDWNDEGTWDACLQGVTTAYIAYSPDVAIPGTTDTIRAFVARAVARGVVRLVLLSGRGEAEAEACERIVADAGVEWTVVRASWFMQNFSEGEFLGMVLSGTVALPTADVPEPFVDADDIADVAVAALSESGHDGQVYEVTGPRLMLMTEVAREISDAAGRKVEFVRVPNEAFTQAVVSSGAPPDIAWLLDYLFKTVLDGRNAHLSDGVRRALGREPADFSTFARRVAAEGVWSSNDEEVVA